jgi:hypothetical protein
MVSHIYVSYLFLVYWMMFSTDQMIAAKGKNKLEGMWKERSLTSLKWYRGIYPERKRKFTKQLFQDILFAWPRCETMPPETEQQCSLLGNDDFMM